MSRNDIFDSATIDSMLSTPSLKWHRDPPDIIPMWIASPDIPIAPQIKNELIKAIQQDNLYYNTSTDALNAISKKINLVNHIPVTSKDIMITQGVDPAIWLAIRYSCQPGDEVVVTNPMYAPFIRVMDVMNTKPVNWNLDKDNGYIFDEEQFKTLISGKTRLIYVCNPHNPTSRVMTKNELKNIADIAVEKGIIVMVDELWEDIIFDNRKHISMASLNPEIENLTITSWGFSKTFGVAGLQLGYICATNKGIMNKIREYARMIQRGSSTIAKAAVPVMLGDEMDWWREGLMEHLNMIREIVKERVKRISCMSLNTIEGTYVPFPYFECNMTSKELGDYLLKEAKVGLSSGSGYGSRGEGHMRICIATSKVIINEAFDRLEESLNKL